MIAKELIYKKLYPGKKFNKQVIWNLTSALEKMTKEFLGQTALNKDKFIKNGLILSEFGKRKLLNDYPKTLKEMEKLLDSGGIEYDYFDNKGRLEIYKQDYYHLIDMVRAMGDSKLKSCEYQILLFLRMTVGGLNDMNLLSDNYNYKYDVNLPGAFARFLDLKSIVEYAYEKNYEYAFLIEIYYLALTMLSEPQNISSLSKIRELFEKNFNKFTDSEKRTILHWIVNYCLGNFEPDDLKIKRIVFELNELRLREGLAFYPENQLPMAIYIQMLKAALTLNETEWAENFITNYTKKLKPDVQDSMRCLAYGFLYFHTKDYRKVLKSLSKIEFKDIQDKFFAKSLIAKSYYELNETEPLLYFIDSTRHYIAGNPQVTELRRVYYFSFLKYIKKIVFIREKKDFEKIQSVRNEIEKNNEISNKKWLLEKLDEVEKEK
jgi:hypothetical protein